MTMSGEQVMPDLDAVSVAADGADARGVLEVTLEQTEKALATVQDRLASLRASREAINDEIRDLVVEEEALTRMIHHGRKAAKIPSDASATA